ncbi:HD domain-containing protein [bacterium]|nr:HD domain-containing protein [bacterium]
MIDQKSLLTNKKRRLFHYAVSFTILVIYGGQVCPFLESLTVLQLSLPILGILLLQFFTIGVWLEPLTMKQPYAIQSRKVFLYDWGAFIIGGVTVTFFNMVAYGFPPGSGAKLLLAMSILGFFIAIDLSLYLEWRLSQFLEKEGINIDPSEHYFSQPKKLVIFSTICSMALVGIIFLVINKDLDWLVNVGETISLESAQRSILIEVAFVVSGLLAYIVNVVLSYSRNFNYFLTKETSVLQRATGGYFDTLVPVSTNDEFGVIAQHTNIMMDSLKRQTEELKLTRDVTIVSLASLAETRDNETGNHILRTQRYVKILAEYMKGQPEFSDFLDEDTISLLFKSAPLHDIGKVGIPDNILLKPGKLTDEEFNIMRRHPHLGGEALRIAEEKLGSNSFLKLAREIALTHHEKWDGTGYPKRLKGENIPISGRLMAVADVYDALISKRVYKAAFSHDEAKEIIVGWRGENFDPRLVDAFLSTEQQFIEVAQEFRDKE